MRALGTTRQERSAELPDVSAIGEALPGYVSTSWFGLFAPAGTPAPAVARISREVAAALRAGPARKRLEQLDYEPVGGTPEEFAAFFAAELPGSPSWCASPARPWIEGGGQPMRVRGLQVAERRRG